MAFDAEAHRRAFPDRAIAGVTRDCEDTSRGYVVTDRQYLREVLRLARTARAAGLAAETDVSEGAPRE